MDFDFENRIVAPEFTSSEDNDIEFSLRPKVLGEYIGQDKVKENLSIYIEAARQRGEPLDHVLLYGPPGLGKTTLASIISREMGVNLRVTSGPAIEKQGDLVAILTSLEEGDVLFIDEIHRLNRQVEEVLYPAMEDFAIDIMIGKGATARSIRLDLPHFTLVGATTRAGQMTTPLRDRFGVILKLELYTPEALATIVRRNAGILMAGGQFGRQIDMYHFIAFFHKGAEEIFILSASSYIHNTESSGCPLRIFLLSSTPNTINEVA